jgi:uncharacterized protein (DUF58 family)
MQSLLAKYLDPELLASLAARRREPLASAAGNLAGMHRSNNSGFALEFVSHRPYAPGDDTRYLDWRVYYRRQRYLVKQYRLETNTTCHLVLDASGSMAVGTGGEQKLAYAARLAATLAWWMVQRGDKVSLAACDRDVRVWLPPAGGPAHVLNLCALLEQISASGPTDAAACFTALAPRFGRRATILYFGDLLGDLPSLAAAIQRLRFDEHTVALFQILHRWERHFEIDGQVRFAGLEGEPAIDCAASDVRQAYLAALAAHQQELAGMCARLQVEHVVAETSRPASQILATVLDHKGA